MQDALRSEATADDDDWVVDHEAIQAAVLHETGAVGVRLPVIEAAVVAVAAPTPIDAAVEESPSTPVAAKVVAEAAPAQPPAPISKPSTPAADLKSPAVRRVFVSESCPWLEDVSQARVAHLTLWALCDPCVVPACH